MWLHLPIIDRFSSDKIRNPKHQARNKSKNKFPKRPSSPLEKRLSFSVVLVLRSELRRVAGTTKDESFLTGSTMPKSGPVLMGGSLKPALSSAEGRSLGLAETRQLCPPTGLFSAPASCWRKTEAGGVYRPDFQKMCRHKEL